MSDVLAKLNQAMTVIQGVQPPFIPADAHAMTAIIEWGPGDRGAPPHRHPGGPCFGYVLEGEMLFELEGEAPRIIKAGEAFWEPGGDVIHYSDGNHRDDVPLRFLVTMLCTPGQEMFVLVDEEELEARKDRRVTAKNITVVGATGQIGRQLVDALTVAGHHVTGASRHSGVDAALGTGLDEALAGADVVIDVLNSPTMDDDAALAFFTATSANVSGAAKKAGVGHYVLLSIVGVDGLQGGGYLRGKVLQENTVAASGVPYTIVRATQFHEFTEMIAGALVDGDQVHAPDALIQPIATADVTAVLARVATEAPLYGVHDVGGPEKMTFAALAAAVLPQQNLRIRTDPAATYFGTPVTETSLVTGAGAELAPTRLADWLGAR